MKNLKNIFYGVICSTFFTILFILLFSLILTKTNFNENYIDTIVIIIFGTCMFIGTTVATRRVQKNGALIGAVMTIFYIITLYIVSSLCLHDFSIKLGSVYMIISTIVLGSIGGVIGVNIK